jgi:hypothetical protein
VRLTTYHHIVPMSRNLGALTLLDPSGPAWPVMGDLYLYLYLYLYLSIIFTCQSHSVWNFQVIGSFIWSKISVIIKRDEYKTVYFKSS